MSAIVLANQIPDDINTMERLHAWSGYALAFMNPNIAILETIDRAEKCAQVATFQAADDSYRVLIRACLPINPSYITDRSIKIWQHIEELSNVVLPAGFTTN